LCGDAHSIVVVILKDGGAVKSRDEGVVMMGVTNRRGKRGGYVKSDELFPVN
jgi:hypothetical protein